MSGYRSLESTSHDQQSSLLFETALHTPQLGQGFAELLKAYDYARITRRNLWNFAVEIEQLRALGLNECDFRWLTCLGLVEHAREITRVEDDGREFRSTGNLTFVDRSCFILTENGSRFARRISERFVIQPPRQNEPSAPTSFQTVERTAPPPLVPDWDPERRELKLAGLLVKQFKWPAANQEMILTAFQEDEWPARVDDPLPPLYELDPRRRLHDTIKCLNRNQKNKRIHFRGDGTGEGVIWELIAPPAGFAEDQVHRSTGWRRSPR